MTRIRPALVSLMLLLSSNAWADLRTYDVDPQYRQEVYSALKSILDPTGIAMKANGRVELLPSGQILVNASPETLVQVDAVLQAIRARPVTPTPRAALRYWAVLGSRTRPATAPGAEPPRVLENVLTELERMHGDLSFWVIGTAAVSTESGQPGTVSGMALEISQTAYVQGDALNATIGINLEGTTQDEAQPRHFSIGDLRVRTTLRRGEFVVLGESEVKSGDLDGPVFFIVHWPEE